MLAKRETSAKKDIREADLIVDVRPSSSSRSVVIFGFFVVVVIFLGLGVWSATAPLARAVAAYATLTVKGERKQIQHFEGGIVSSLHVVEGQLVKKGELLVALHPVQATAVLVTNSRLLDQALVREGRLQSELLNGDAIIVEGQLLERLAKNKDMIDMLDAEERHFIARSDVHAGTIAILNQRIDQLNSEIKGLEIQRVSRFEQLNIFKEEMIGLRGLYEKGYFPKSKILAFERSIAQLRGAAGADLAQIARAKSAQGEAKKQIGSVNSRRREQIVEELRDVKANISELNERVIVAEDILQRIEIRAPQSGIIQGIQVHTIGGVIGAGTILMDLVPQDAELFVFAQVSPFNIDSVAIGQRAEVRLTSLNSRTTPAIYGDVVSISGDSLTDSRAEGPYFLTRIKIPVEEREKLGEIKLTAGMPAEVLIQTGERTALDYLIRPMKDAFSRGLNED
jgi:HlyD family type I secretion membrane fusion protein